MTDAEVAKLVERYMRESETECTRFRLSLGRPFISRFCPGRTHEVDVARREKIDEYMRKWTSDWWAVRGFRMVVLDEETTAFTVEEIGPSSE